MCRIRRPRSDVIIEEGRPWTWRALDVAAAAPTVTTFTVVYTTAHQASRALWTWLWDPLGYAAEPR